MQAVHKVDDVVITVDGYEAANDAAFDNVQYVKKATLQWKDLKPYFGIYRDSAGRYWQGSKSQSYVCEYLSNIRMPSRRWPNSYAKALLTQKFAKLVVAKEPRLALRLGIAEMVTGKSD